MTRRLCRHADLGKTGHFCYRYIGAGATQGTVFANGTPVLRRGDPAFTHTILRGRRCKDHKANIKSGSSTVFCQGIPVARVDDSFDKAWMIQGSDNVFAGG